ncbi:hypothetical protein [Sulfitobacter sp.]|jgi:hypothetical protein|uniref:hypothetical protein n=1 Tax=Sulfitobacter sp. TaxID=1903071 RepID=UPI003003842A
MTSLVYYNRRAKAGEVTNFDDYLKAAAKIVETIAFEAASQAPAATVEELLRLACGIEYAAAKLKRAN